MWCPIERRLSLFSALNTFQAIRSLPGAIRQVGDVLFLFEPAAAPFAVYISVYLWLSDTVFRFVLPLFTAASFTLPAFKVA